MQPGSGPGVPRQWRAVQPEYAGCSQAPPFWEKYTPETPTPSVNGQSVSGPALQASMSISSFAPAALYAGLLGSTATAGSFCLFWENGNGAYGLPVVTSASCCADAAGAAISSAAT